MERRACKRIPVNIKTEFRYGNKDYSGTVMNLSENGMFISTGICSPIKTRFEVRVKLKDEILKVPVMNVRIEKSDDMYKGMGVKILSIPKKYLEFVIKLALG